MQFYPLQGKYKDKVSNSQDQEIPSELVLKIKEDFIKNGGNKDVLEDQYSADLVHRVLGSVKNSAEAEYEKTRSSADSALSKGDKKRLTK